MLKLVYEENGRTQEVPLRGIVRIGRDPSAEIVTADRSVSKRHVTCTVSGGKAMAQDEASANGMFVNGARVTEAVLQEGDVLRAGTFELRVVAASVPVPADDGTMVDYAFAPAPAAARPVFPDEVEDVFSQAAVAPQVALGAAAAPPAPPSPQGLRLAVPAAPPTPHGVPFTVPIGIAPAASPAPTALGFLTIVRGMPGRRFELRAGTRLGLGTKEDNAVALVGEGISRHHSEIVPRGKDWVVRDLGSKNGTYVNGRRTTERVLAHGDRVAIGSVELEFASASGAAPAPVRRRPRAGLALAGVAAAVLLGAFFFRPPPAPAKVDPPPPHDDEDRERKLAIKLLQALDGFAASLRERFLDPTLTGQTSAQLAETLRLMLPQHPDRRLVTGLASLLNECQNRQPSYVDMNWRQLEASAVELRNYPTGARLAGAILEWSRAEHVDRGHIGDGLDYLRSTRPEEAFSAFKRVRVESVYARAAAARMLEVKDLLADRTVRAVQPYLAAGDYQAALDQVNRLLDLLEGRYPDVVVVVQPIKRECERYLRFQIMLREAETLFAGGKLTEARDKLDTISGAPDAISRQAERLAVDIDARRLWLQARERFDSGDGPDVALLLRDAVHPDLVKLRSLAQKVVDLARTAQKAEADFREEDAAVAWSQVKVLIEDSPNNSYYKDSLTRGKRPDLAARAARAYQAGLSALQEGDTAEARKQFDAAKDIFPRHADSTQAIESFFREKELAFNRDLILFRDGKLRLDELIPRWESVLAFLHPQDRIYDKYSRELAKLR